MNLHIDESVQLPAPPARVWSILASLEGMVLFKGFGPIPGIARASWITEGGYRLGGQRTVTNTDGSKHVEDVSALEPERLLEDLIHDFDGPLRFLARQARDRFELAPTGAGTRLSRRFEIALISPLVLPVGLLLVPLMRRALRRHHDELVRALAS